MKQARSQHAGRSREPQFCWQGLCCVICAPKPGCWPAPLCLATVPCLLQVRKQYGVKKDLLGLLEGRETYVIGKDGIVKLVSVLSICHTFKYARASADTFAALSVRVCHVKTWCQHLQCCIARYKASATVFKRWCTEFLSWMGSLC